MLTRARNYGIVESTAPSPAIKLSNGKWVPADNIGSVEEYLGRQLKLDLQRSKQESLIEAMEKPTDWLAKRNAAYDDIKKRIAGVYAIQMGKYYTAGFPVEEAQQLAENAANALLQIELRDLEMTLPGANTVFASAANTQAARESKYALAEGVAEHRKSDKEIYKRYRAKKKAKKAKRAAKKSQQ
jgi:hypothetical protein